MRLIAHPATVLIVASLYLTPVVYRGWIPHDQGTLAQCAERLLAGELPHRDFDAMYTGGLTWLNALAFVLFGVKLSSIRTVFLLFTLAFVATFHWLSRKMLSPVLAAVTTFVAIAWSVPNYFAAMPSWYNLYFAVFGIAALVKYSEDPRLRWVLIAGLCGGLSILFKITGLYYVAAVLLFLAYRATAIESDGAPLVARERWISAGLAATASAVWVAMVALLVRSQMNAMVFAQLLLPSLVVCAVWVHQAYHRPLCAWKPMRSLLATLGAFAVGVLVPVLLYASVYVLAGAVGELVYGVFVSPFARVDGVTYPFPNDTASLIAMASLALLCIFSARLPRLDGIFALLLLLPAALLVVTLPVVLARDAVFLLARVAPPGLALLCGLKLAERWREAASPALQRQFLLLAAAACLPLIQFPFAAPIYFCFVFPVLLLQAQTLFASLPVPVWKVQWSASFLLLVFGIFYVGRIPFFDDPRLTAVDPPAQQLDLKRAGLLVTNRDKEVYEPLVEAIQKHSGPGDYVLAFPDCPEVYFLSERQNRTRTLFDLFDARKEGRVERLLRGSSARPKVLVINTEPNHSRRLTEQQLERVKHEYRQSEQIGPFLVCFDE